MLGANNMEENIISIITTGVHNYMSLNFSPLVMLAKDDGRCSISERLHFAHSYINMKENCSSSNSGFNFDITMVLFSYTIKK